ncbi:hypothetical protein ORI20_23315 [Mycobacterium sp. CVI_P3]|uniref:PE-PGRS family protein n=1 Tax=Mycobacterium pinniadriaticum TaxID=2994102 RepID=A0ABT3SJT3_9MYCO|nr:hypothetical protein [Mycobacterium pinniadriaticum]MCX2933205.1 hypothetical protein [Mycobacterium pinniadriaticum]MCX2939627.1 hypothetical protein [Mycobacterium pinniadriaticum]
MHIAVRSSVATGIALVGAGAIALSPVQPVASPLSNLPAAISNAGVELTATFDPITPWVDVITAAVTNTVTIGEDWLADPLPAARQLANNWFGYADTTATALGGVAEGTWTYLTTTVPEGLSTAFDQIVNGDLSGAATTINNVLGSAVFTIGLPLFPVAEIPGQMADNFAAVVNAVTGIGTLLPVVIGLLGPIEGGVQAFGDSGQAVLDAVQASEPVTALNAAFALVPNVLGAVLNGYQNNTYPGLLSPVSGGLVYSLAITIPQAIATALGATTMVAAASKAAPSAEAVAADEPTTTDSSAGTARSKAVATPAADDPADDAVAEPAAAAKPVVKDGNKFEPGDVSGSGAAGARTASASAKAAASNSGTAKSATGAGSGKGHSARGDK